MGARLGAIALLAMLVRAVVPAGYMLAQAETASGRYHHRRHVRGPWRGQRVIDLDTGKPLDPSQLPGKDTTSKTQARALRVRRRSVRSPRR